jgi:hypothetical protein
MPAVELTLRPCKSGKKQPFRANKGHAENPAVNGFNRVGITQSIFFIMKKVSIQKKLSFKKGLVANLNEEETHAIQGGINTSIGWPCACPQPTQQSNVPCACPTSGNDFCPCGGTFRMCESDVPM